MSEAVHPAWDDPELGDPTDSARRALYRRKQSWYREVVLGLPPGRDEHGRLVGSLLPVEAVEARPDVAFIEDSAAYVDERLGRVKARPTVDEQALRRDLLSPVGLAFNLLTSLRDRTLAAERVLRAIVRSEITHLESLEVEPEPPTGESGWLDALAIYRVPSGKLGFVGIVCRYADQPSRLEVGTAVAHHGADRLRSDAVSGLAEAGAIDLWASAAEVDVLLAGSEAVTGHLAVLAPAHDAATWRAVAILRNDPAVGGALTRAASYEEVLRAVIQRDGLSGWADNFAARYLDLGVVS